MLIEEYANQFTIKKSEVAEIRDVAEKREHNKKSMHGNEAVSEERSAF